MVECLTHFERNCDLDSTNVRDLQGQVRRLQHFNS